MRTLLRRLAGIAGRVPGVMGIAVHDVETGEEIGVHADEPFPMASVCKTPILVHTYRMAEAGKADLDTRTMFTRAHRTPGSGLFNFFDEGLQLTLRDLLLMMIVVSDNAATDLVLSQIGGPQAVTATMRQLGLGHIHLDRTIRQLLGDIAAQIEPRTVGLDYDSLQTLYSEEEVAVKFRSLESVRAAIHATTQEQDTATPRDIARLYAQIARHECASPESCEAILTTLERQVLRGRLPRELPSNTRVCHKTGTLGYGTVTNDSGLIYVQEKPVAVAVLSRDVQQAPARTNTAISHVGRAVYEHFAS